MTIILSILNFSNKCNYSESDVHLLSTERHNFNFIQRILSARSLHKLSLDELAIVAFLTQNCYTHLKLFIFECDVYIKNATVVCQRLNPSTCKYFILYNIIRTCYCKCQTTKKGIRYFHGACKDSFDCNGLQQIHFKMKTMNITQKEEFILKHIINDLCRNGDNIDYELVLRKLTLTFKMLNVSLLLLLAAFKNKTLLQSLVIVTLWLVISNFILFLLYKYDFELEYYVVDVGLGFQWVCHDMTYVNAFTEFTFGMTIPFVLVDYFFMDSKLLIKPVHLFFSIILTFTLENSLISVNKHLCKGIYDFCNWHETC